MFTAILLLCIGQVVSGSRLFQVYEFSETDNKAPIYVQQLQNIKVYSETWSIVTLMDFTFFEDEFKKVLAVTNETRLLCTSLYNTYKMDQLETTYKLTSGCNTTVQKLENMMEEMKDVIWKQLEGVGSLPINDAEAYVEHFKKNKPAKKMIIHHATLIETSPNMFSSSTDKLRIEYEQATRQINDIMAISQRKVSNNELKGARMKHLLEDLLSYITVVSMDFKVRQQALMSLLTSGCSFYQTVLPSEVFLNELKELADLLRLTKVQLPFNIEHGSIALFNEVATVKCRMLNRQYLVSYTIPIVEAFEFTLHQLTAYPRKLKDELFALIVPDLQYVGLDKDMENYIHINERDLNRCYVNGTDTLLCELSGPIISTRESGSCAINLLTKAELPLYCNYNITNVSGEIWFQMRKSNVWLFVVPNTQLVSIECNGEIENRFIQGAGTLMLSTFYTAKTKHVFIKGMISNRYNGKHFKVRAQMKMNSTQMLDKLRTSVNNNVGVSDLDNVGVTDLIKYRINNTVDDRINEQTQKIVTEHEKLLVRSDIAIYLWLFGMTFLVGCKTFFFFKAKCCGRTPFTNVRHNIEHETSVEEMSNFA